MKNYKRNNCFKNINNRKKTLVLCKITQPTIKRYTVNANIKTNTQRHLYKHINIDVRISVCVHVCIYMYIQ